MVFAISCAERFSVPLNRRCSMKWEIPFSLSVSWRDPCLSQTPRQTDLILGMASVRRVRPLGRTCRRIIVDPGCTEEGALRWRMRAVPRSTSACAEEEAGLYHRPDARHKDQKTW